MPLGRLGPSVNGYLRGVADEVDYLADTLLSSAKPPPPPMKLPPPVKPQPPTPTPKVTMETPAEPVALKLPDTIQAAAQKKVEAELSPILKKTAHLKSCLAVYEKATQVEIERRVTNSILAALGQEPTPEVEGVAKATEYLRAALLEMGALVGGVSPFESPVPAGVQPVPEAEPEPSETAASLPKPPLKAKQADVDRAKNLIDEIENLSGKVSKQHPVRLAHLLQALVAEARGLMERLPDTHPLEDRLSQLMPVLGAMRIEGEVQGFIQGLAFGAKADWKRLSQESRQRLAQFNRDAAAASAAPPPPPPKSAPRQKVEVDRPHTPHTWPKLPRLRAVLQKKPLVIVGGIVVNEKLTLCANRFGIKAEWHETQGDAARSVEAMASSIRAGGPGAVILLEGLIGHKTSNKIIEACRARGVPFGLADKGGTASLEDALNQLEQKIAC